MRRRVKTMKEFYKKLDELYAAGDLKAVEAFIHGAIGESREGSPQRAGLYNELAGFYRGVSRYAESEDAFINALNVFESVGMGSTPEYATVLVNLAGLYRMRGEADKAIDLFYDAMKKLENAGARNGYSYVSVINNLALAFQEKGDYARALEYAGRALNILRAADSPNEHEIAASLNNLATIRLRLGELDIADNLISESLGIYESMAETNVHHAAALTTKGVIQCRAGNYRGALDGFLLALELTRRFFGENIEFAICRRNIADVHELLGDIPSAIAELSDAVRIMGNIFGEEHNSVKDARGKLERLRSIKI